MTTMTTTSWPEVSSTATLRWALATMDARILRHEDDAITLALVSSQRRPGPMPRIGAEMDLCWADAAGLHERRVALDAQRHALLHLHACGDVTSTQRRRFFRAPVTVDLTISAGTRLVEGTSMDLSEGGVRAEVDIPALLPGTPATTCVAIGDARYALPSTVVRNVERDGRAELGLAFGDLPAAAADMIRREVFTAQVEARRNGQRT